MRAWIPFAAAISIAALALLAGCGGAGHTSTPTIPKEAFVARAEAICKPAERQLARLHYPRYSPNKYTALLKADGRITEEGVAIERKTWGELEELPRPAVGASIVGDWLGAMREVAKQSLLEARSDEVGIERHFDSAAVKREVRARNAFGIKCDVG